MNRRTLLAAGTLALSLAAISVHAMPGPDDNMESWPQKLKEVAQPNDLGRVADPGQVQIQKLNRTRVEPEPQPWKVRTLKNGQ
jgi:hypothetical protein